MILSPAITALPIGTNEIAIAHRGTEHNLKGGIQNGLTDLGMVTADGNAQVFDARPARFMARGGNEFRRASDMGLAAAGPIKHQSQGLHCHEDS